MATPGALVRALADVLDLDPASVAQQDRFLAQANIRQKGGRGSSAARMTPRDAASLLLAVLAPPLSRPQVRETVHTFKAYSDLRAHLSPELNPFDLADDRGDWRQLAILRELPSGHSLLAVLTSLISVFMDGLFENAQQVWGADAARFVFGHAGYVVDATKAPVSLRVSFICRSSAPASEICIFCPAEGADLRAQLEYRPSQGKVAQSKTDRVQTTTISEVTFRAIADLLNNDRRLGK